MHEDRHDGAGRCRSERRGMTQTKRSLPAVRKWSKGNGKGFIYSRKSGSGCKKKLSEADLIKVDRILELSSGVIPITRSEDED